MGEWVLDFDNEDTDLDYTEILPGDTFTYTQFMEIPTTDQLKLTFSAGTEGTDIAYFTAAD